MKIRAVTFDFWGTLYDSISAETGYRPRRRAELVRTLLEPYMPSAAPLPLDRLEGLLHRASRLRAQGLPYERSIGFARRTDFSAADEIGGARRSAEPITASLTVAERLDWVARELGVSVPEEALGPMAAEVSGQGRDVPPRPFESAKAALENLSRDFELGIVSDTGLTAGEALREIMRADGLAPPVRAFSFSDETGVSKPHAGAFLHVLDELGVRPAEAVHVGDVVATDVAGACALGMGAVWIREEAARGPPEGCAAAVVTSLAEVPAAIRSMF